MSWTETKLEAYVKQELSKVLDVPTAENLFSCYVVARDNAMKVAEEIKAKEENLSDHGPRHIKDVLENAWELVHGQDICVLNLYVLCLSIAYHDIGNFYGREKHNQRIAEIFNDTFPEHDEKRNLLRLAAKIAGAHTGKGSDKSKDTLQDLSDDADFFIKKPILSRSIASILRFADEMAEGPQRTCAFRLKKKDYEEGSHIFHQYAKCFGGFGADRKRGRISMTYNVPIVVIDKEVHIYGGEELTLTTMLEFIYERIVKFDQERKYCKFYCSYLADFNETSVYFDFLQDDVQQLPMDLNKLVLNDLTIPGQDKKSISDINDSYEITKIVSKVSELCSDSSSDDDGKPIATAGSRKKDILSGFRSLLGGGNG